eukprot:6255531-Amphidinium_carterae.1
MGLVSTVNHSRLRLPVTSACAHIALTVITSKPLISSMVWSREKRGLGVPAWLDSLQDTVAGYG